MNVTRLTALFLLIVSVLPVHAKRVNCHGMRPFERNLSSSTPASLRDTLPGSSDSLQEARKTGNWEQAYRLYRKKMYNTDEQLQLTYADSMLYAAEKTGSKEIIGAAYLTRGILHYSRKEHTAALDNYIIANRYIATTQNRYLRYKTVYNMGLIKYYLGYYNDALSLFSDAAAYYRDNHTMAYINSLHNMGLCYNRLKTIRKAEVLADQALELARKHDYKKIIPHLLLLKASNAYYNKTYDTSLRLIKSAMADLDPTEDFASLMVGYHYTGRNYWDLGKREKAVAAFKKVDSLARDSNYIRPDLRKGFELLIDYYRAKNDSGSELVCIRRLLELDKTLEKDFKYLSTVIHKQYDTHGLVEARDRIEKRLARESLVKTISFYGIGALSATLLVVIMYHRHITAKYRRRFKELMANAVTSSPKRAAVGAVEGMNPEVQAGILARLEEFEHNNAFTRQDIRADDLAREFGTNYKYLTRVIHHYRGKNFTDYLNELRIDYILQQLKENPKLRLYTNTALAAEAGFSTAQHFVRAFGAKTGIPPTFFIRELEKISSKNQD